MDMLEGSSSKSSDGSFWSTVTSSPSKLGTEFTGPNYSYAKWIKTPTELGMGSKPDQLGQNVAGIMDYITIITEGGGPASKNDGLPLGDRYFLETGGHCKAKDSTVKRSLYINNVPDGSIPFLSGMNIHLSSQKGLLPGVLGDLGNMNPVHLFSAFTQGSTPACMNINMNTIDTNNNAGTGSGFVLNTEVEKIAPCAFVNGKNPITGGTCIESFVEANRKMHGKKKKKKKSKYNLESKPLANIYTALVGGLLIYLIYNIATKKK